MVNTKLNNVNRSLEEFTLCIPICPEPATVLLFGLGAVMLVRKS
ncbi:MAG: PEP-CTERM sorting domain-containing protein [Candidatus Brocadiia bacterium]|nr:MAG: PEP-CTERM sorting domain-containing protein [Candidatus Brocadiia bacterium]